MKSKLALLLATLLFFNIILPIRVSAASIQDQSRPIFGLTADQVVEKYNQLTDQQKDQVLRSLGNTSIFANSLFGNIFNSTFGALDDAIEKIGDLFFQANGVIYKLGSSALAWVSRLIDKVFNNDLSDLNISQPVIDDLYLNTRDLSFYNPPFFVQPNIPSQWDSGGYNFNVFFPLPSSSDIFYLQSGTRHYLDGSSSVNNTVYGYPIGLTVNDDLKVIKFGYIVYNQNTMFFQNWGTSISKSNYFDFSNEVWVAALNPNEVVNQQFYYSVNYSGDYHAPLLNLLKSYFCKIPFYYLVVNNYVSIIPLSSEGENLLITNNTYYNYIYNIPVQTPLNVTNIVSNTSINYDPVENLIQYLPDNYNIEQNFSVVNNYYILSGSAISGQAIDVNIVSPGVIDVRVINPEDLTQQVTNNVSKDIINNTDVNFGDLDFSPSITVGLNAAKDSIEGIVPVTGSSIVAQFVSGIPPDWLALGFVFLILFIASGFGLSIIRH